MTPLQQIECSSEQLSILASIYEENNLHELRQRGHAIILRNKGYSLEDIAFVLERNKWDIVIIVKAFFHFGFEGLHNLDYDNLLNRIKEIEEPPTQQRNTSFWLWLNRLLEPLVRYLIIIFFGLLVFKGFELFASSKNGKYLPLILLIIPILLLGWVVKWLTESLFFKNEHTNTNPENTSKNSLNFIGSGNFINQFIFNYNGELRHIKERREFIDVIEKAAAIPEGLKSDDKRILALISLAKKFNHKKLNRSLIITIGGSIIYWSIKYSASVKAGFLIVALFSIQITATVLSEDEAIETQKSKNIEKVIISSDTITTSPNIQSNETLYDFSKMPVSTEHEFLIDMEEEVAAFMKNDSIDYTFEDYFVNEKDDRAYLQVASYIDIRHAAIQRKNLIENHGFKIDACKILYCNIFGRNLFGVTIGDAPRDNINLLTKIQDDWNAKAKSSNVRAYLKTN